MSFISPEIDRLISDVLNDTTDGRLVGSPTNSPIGCQHWYNTLLANIIHVGEFMEMDLFQKAAPEQVAAYGKSIAENARHLIANYDKIPFKW